jgi:membrane associated rhomboid family serine protease
MQAGTMSLMEIYRSNRLADCEQRAFVLKAVGIEYAVFSYSVLSKDDLFALMVPEEWVATAVGHLQSYDEESRAIPTPPPAPLPVHPRARIGACAYVVMLIGVAWLVGESYGGVDWLKAGALTHAATGDHQWWRAVTALTLHADLGHLLGNLLFGVPFGYFAAQLLGNGRAWLSILIAATAGNLLDSAAMPSQQETIGASTAVFAMLGLVAAYAWRKGSGKSKRSAHSWAPLIAGIALLGITGAGGENTDVFAHLSGFAAGALLGVVHAHLRTPVLDGRIGQFIAGALTVAAVVGAWALAL